jgi:soluble lytic murein transglycosylase
VQFEREKSTPDTQLLAIYKPITRRIKALYDSRQISEASRLTNDFGSELPKEEKSAFINWIAHELHWYAKSVYLSQDEELANQLSLRFPLAYLDLVKQQSLTYHLPEALIYAVIRQESAFRDDVVSPAGAHGLMQLMPSTALWISRLYHIPYQHKSQLFKSYENIHLGAAYLSQLAKSYHDNPVLMVAAYNAGPKQVNQWLTALPLEQTDIWIEIIPYAETRNYLKNIISFYAVFRHQLHQNPNLEYFIPAINHVALKSEAHVLPTIDI